MQFSRRNITQFKEAVGTIAAAADTASSKAIEPFIKETQRVLETADTILIQQKNIYQDLPIKEHIVSVHKLYTRLMVRSRYPIEVEFGPKALFNFKNKYLFLESLNFANVSDTNSLGTAIDAYKERFGVYLSQLSTDRGFWSKENFRLAQEKNISKIVIENKGKSSYLTHKPLGNACAV